MDPLITYSIPVKGLYNGIHQFEFQIDRFFFENFEQSPVTEGDVQVRLDFDKHPDMYVLQFELAGTVRTECDRCLAEIDLPIASSQRLLVKFSLEEEEDEADIAYISPEASLFNVAQYIYEFICLALPIIKAYDCEDQSPRPCNEEMLRYLRHSEEDSALEEDEAEQEDPNPIWDELKKLSNDN
jgi:uncharacterized protein